ncbi:MAG: GvpL/GvpF family gas vesicle protein [Myxococcaceae bacterium]|nr:GvpL/GvpF family gas vesicle protein [Myxococcaceae bacterium]
MARQLEKKRPKSRAKTTRAAAKETTKKVTQKAPKVAKKKSPSRSQAKVVPLVPGKEKTPAKAPHAAPESEVHEELRAAAVADAPARTAQADSSPSRGKYVYCIIRSDEELSFGKIGIGPVPSEVHTILYKDLGAVVSDTPIGILDPTRENVLAHQRVNETVMRDHTVLPMSFGTVFKTREDIIELLKSAYQPFGDVLSKMEDKVEFGLKVLWDRDQVIKEIEGEDEGLRRLKGEIANQKGSTYFARMQYGRMVDAALQARSERYVAEIFQALRDVSVASRTNKPIGDKMILNAAFLVARQKEQAFDAKVKEIGARLDKLTFKYTGPWPAYNFVNIRLKLERANAK